MRLFIFIYLFTHTIYGNQQLLKYEINENVDEGTTHGYEVYEKIDEIESTTNKNIDDIKWMILPNGRGDISMAILSGLSPTTEAPVEDIEFYLYSRQNPKKAELRFMNSKCLPKFNYFKAGRPTKFLIHGFGDSISESLMYPLFRDAFITRGDYNIFMVDWSKLAAVPWYNSASKNTLRVGQHSAKFLDHLSRSTGMNLSSVHLIGFSLGAHVAGIIGQSVTKGRIKRITALDPAEILYTTKPKNERLDPSDADFVEVLHTSGGYLGFEDPLGHRDIFPNGGIWPQPGCYVDYAGVCSHRRAYYYYGEAIKNKKGFKAIPCNSWAQFMSGACDKNLENSFELANDNRSKRRLKGKFYLKTNNESPFGIVADKENVPNEFDYFSFF